MKPKIIILLLPLFFAFYHARAAAPVGAAAVEAGIKEQAENAAYLLKTLLVDLNADSSRELKNRILALKAARQELGEENLLRIQLQEEAARTQYCIQALAAGRDLGAMDDAGRLSTLKRMAKILTAASVETEDTLRAKAAMRELRVAISVFRGAHGGLPPNDPIELVGKGLKSIPAIRLPGHVRTNGSVKILKGIKNTEDAFLRVGDEGGWLYVGDKSSPMNGFIFFNCSHRDFNGSALYRY
jgi:hypothetical protein